MSDSFLEGLSNSKKNAHHWHVALKTSCSRSAVCFIAVLIVAWGSLYSETRPSLAQLKCITRLQMLWRLRGAYLMKQRFFQTAAPLTLSDPSTFFYPPVIRLVWSAAAHLLQCTASNAMCDAPAHANVQRGCIFPAHLVAWMNVAIALHVSQPLAVTALSRGPKFQSSK